MILSLRRRFIHLSVVALFTLLTLLVVGMNLINYQNVCRDADGILAILAENQGRFPGVGNNDYNNYYSNPSNKETAPDAGNASGGYPALRPNGSQNPLLDPTYDALSPETPYESRFFSVLFDANGEILEIYTRRITAVDEEQAAEYARCAVDGRSDSGWCDIYRYARSSLEGGTLVVFLDCGRTLDSFHGFLTTSALLSLGAFALISLLFLFFSNRLMRPILETYEMQHRFITDAGHELKTPLAIIRANADLLEMDLGENESIDEIRAQTQRLSTLTSELVLLSRTEEGAKVQKSDFPISEVVAEAASSFRALAITRRQTIDCNIEPSLTLCGDRSTISKLVSLLLDNALKYSPEGATISVTLSREAKAIALSIENPTEQPLETTQLSHLLERFYRADPSRNSSTGGYGIGLSVADAIVSSHGGKLSISAPDECRFRITAAFPA